MNEFNKQNILKLPFSYRPPRKARSAYAFYIKEHFKRVRQNFGLKQNVSVIRQLAYNWKRFCTGADRKRFIDEAAEDRQRYRNEFIEWSTRFNGKKPRIAKRRAKAAGKPKKPLTSFNLYLRDTWKETRAEFKNTPHQHLFKEIAKKWNLMKPEEKRDYVLRSKVDRREYSKQVRDWKQMIKLRRSTNRENRQITRLAALRSRFLGERAVVDVIVENVEEPSSTLTEKSVFVRE